MKYFSELTNKTYDTEEACVKAETEYAELEAKKREEATAVSKEKREMAKVVEDTEAVLDKAIHDYNEAREEARKICEEATKKADGIIAKAKAEVEKAQRSRYEAIADFNKKFGVYTTHYTGDKALKELRRSMEWMNGVFNNFFW